MAVQLINIGNVANDGTGDDLREAFIKVNQNFEELDLRDDEQTTAVNLGSTGEGVFYNRINYELQFKKIANGDNITLVADDQKITISSFAGVTDITVSADTGSNLLENSASLAINGGPGITTDITDGVITITNTRLSEIVEDTTPQLGGNLDAQGFDLLNVGNITAASVTGSFTGNINGVDPSQWASYFEGFDFGDLGTGVPVISILDWIVRTTDVDLGSINNPAVKSIDLGFI